MFGKTSNAWDTIIDLDRLWQQFKRIIRPKGVVVLTALSTIFTWMLFH